MYPDRAKRKACDFTEDFPVGHNAVKEKLEDRTQRGGEAWRGLDEEFGDGGV